jgi:bla regulator protein blaR1
MMQSLLADRFKLAVHFESREQPALALILVKPPTLGPRIRPHSQGLSCDAKWTAPLDRGSSSVPAGGILPTCGAFNAIDTPKHTVLFGARDVTLKSLAANLGIIPIVSRFSRPVVDETGIQGSFDLSVEFSPERGDSQSANALDTEGLSLEEAVEGSGQIAH